ncbi:2,3-bisphosphoglycerate-dependent phosphoglycerate mutase 1 isoform X1 [Rosa chinensis]|uniref:2,3-bisphosphoglycerate-dependent phosphoglycerate mutase 1 isoform X1 n=1 Tax=Rosa chinensis TaxID=74649 RepID=UPI001AD8A915|nr:2,3-bisphosphoglycerate-dependent phosphoglycerate mutase 1 isoform X1 [Rosa chinensis]XP_040369842.1 2,3-bisphosphoglycerate-dependent phosphoglycerate mutase 1 isoform X1 [Rosa chinensis]
MVAAAFRHPVGIIQLHGSLSDAGSASKCGHSSFRFISKNFAVDVALLGKGHCSYRQGQQHVVRALSSQAQTTCPSSSSSHVESALILIRHGESMWNEKNLFTGCVDVPLTKRGVDEAIEAGKRISNIPVDMIYTSSLIRAQMTAMLTMTQHHCKKVPIIMHNENRQAKSWSQIYSEDTEKQSIPVITAWQLNERMYGELQGLNKLETAERYGKEQVHEWRRSYNSPPPNGESLEMCSHRAVAYFKDHIQPQLQSGRHVMVAAHGNSLRSIIMYLENLTSLEVVNLELPTGLPLLYIYKEGKFMRRGSPVGPTEAGVYAYTEQLIVHGTCQASSHKPG